MFFALAALWVVGGLSSASGTAPAPAYPVPPPTASVVSASTMTLRRQVEEVRVVFAVRDGHKLVTDVSPAQLMFLDNGQQPAAITTFQQDSDMPLQVALVVDHSDSMQKGFADEQLAARQFLERFLRPNVDSVFVVGFSGKVAVSPLGTTASSNLTAGLEASGQTALYDAIIAAAKAFDDSAPPSGPSRRVIVLLSDGEDNYSRSGFADALEALERADAALYAVTAHDSRHEYRGDSVLRRLASATGGRAFILNSYAGVRAVFPQIEDELRTQYSVTFRPATPRSCGYHAIQILPRNAKLRISAREGYYACSE